MTSLDPRGAAELRPPRPVLVELASAILVIGSFMDGALSFQRMLDATSQEARLFASAAVVVAAGLIGLGVMIRSGKLWLVTLNVVAVAAFLELQTVSYLGILAALIDMVVVGVLLRERAWFRWTPDPATDGRADA